jgi:uncharacterized protein (TIGR02301 family)
VRRRAALLAAVAALALAGPADAQFYWPWQTRPAPPPPPPVYQPQRPARPVHRPASRTDTPQQRSRIETRPNAAKPDGKAAEAPEPPPPVYEPKLLRLSEVMGALAFLRPLCGGKDENEWRDRMNALIDAEASTTGRRERLAGAYNRGYRGLSITYRRCTPNAEQLIGRYLDEGSRLARELSTRYGG